MYRTHDDRLQRTAQAIAARRRERRRIILRRMPEAHESRSEAVPGEKPSDFALRAAQARALLTTRKQS